MMNDLLADYNFGSTMAQRWNRCFGLFAGLRIEKKEIRDSINHLNSLRKYYPQRMMRIKGMADALGLNAPTLQAWAFRAANLLRIACTSTFIASPATPDGEIYLSWNMDVMTAMKWMRNMPLYVHDAPGCNRYVAFGFPGFMGLGFLNEKGLSFVHAGVGMSDGGGDGLFDHELNNLCLETCSDISEVKEKYQATPTYSFSGFGASIFMNLNCIWGDLKGNGLAIEHSANHIEYHGDENGILAITNHHQFLDRRLTGSPDPDRQAAIAGSFCRLGRMWNLLRKHHGKIDFARLKHVMSDHTVETEHLEGYSYEEPIDDATICVHYTNIPRYLKERRFEKAYEAYIAGKTEMALIIQPKTFTIWKCSGNPCHERFIPLRFGDLLRGDGSNAAPMQVRYNTFADRLAYAIPSINSARDIFYRNYIRKNNIFIFSMLEKTLPAGVKKTSE